MEALRIYAAYLKDWDRVKPLSHIRQYGQTYANNLIMPNGDLILLDFGGTLGSRARGEHKHGEVFSNAIGSFHILESAREIYNSFHIDVGPNHPWNNLTEAGILHAINGLKKLSDDNIISIVKSAEYSSREDQDYMIRALIGRRNALLIGLNDLFLK